jgi:hypothetical protein
MALFLAAVQWFSIFSQVPTIFFSILPTGCFCWLGNKGRAVLVSKVSALPAPLKEPVFCPVPMTWEMQTCKSFSVHFITSLVLGLSSFASQGLWSLLYASIVLSFHVPSGLWELWGSELLAMCYLESVGNFFLRIYLFVCLQDYDLSSGSPAC